MSSRVATAIWILSAAIVVGAVAAAITHGEFQATLVVIPIFAVAAFVLLTIGSLLRPFPRTGTAGRFIVRAGIIGVLAIPAELIASRAVVAIDIARSKRYIATKLAPRLEQHRRATGRYPASSELRLWQRPPEDAPWLIQRFHYSSDGQTYSLSVMDPGICGRVTSYWSAVDKWGQAYEPCFY